MTPASIPADFWDRYPAAMRPTSPPIALGNAGGFSGSDLWRVESAVGTLMLRAWPPGLHDRAHIDRVHRWLAGASQLPWLATPLPDRLGLTWQSAEGRIWEVAPFLAGSADLGRPPTEAHLAGMFAALGRVHRELGLDATLGRSPGLIARNAELNQLLDREFGEFERVLSVVVGDESRDLAGRWLTLARFAARRLVGPLRFEQVTREVHRLQPVLRDVRPDHFLFLEDRLNGLVDFGAMGVDSVATDLARLLGETVGRSATLRHRALIAYEAVRPLPATDRDSIPHFEAANAVLAGARWVRWHFVARRPFDDPRAAVLGLKRALTKLDEWTG